MNTDHHAIHNRISIRAVLVRDGEDPTAALAKAGLIDAVALPVIIGDEPDAVGGIFGDGRTPNVTAILETVRDNDAFEVSDDQADAAPPDTEAPRPPVRTTATLPSAYGITPLAPVTRYSGTK